METMTEIIAAWKAGKHGEVVEHLAKRHPAITALVLVQGAQERLLNRCDCNAITNLLMDHQRAELESE